MAYHVAVFVLGGVRMDNAFDVVVIGGGIAGASIGALLAAGRSVAVLEREAHVGVHSTGRSAALFSEIYGNAAVRLLSRGSRDFLFSPPQGFTDVPLVHPRGVMWLARADQVERLRAYAAAPDVDLATRWLTAGEVRSICPIIRKDYVNAGLLEPAACDLDVSAIHHGYIKLLAARGGRLCTKSGVTGLDFKGGVWRVECGDEIFSAPVIVNAAGAWADEIAALAGQPPIGLQPMRRTAVLIEAPEDPPSRDWPLVVDTDEEFYFKPDAGLLLISPADETPSSPCDAQPEELDIAIAVSRIELATTLQIQRVRSRWAGLRSFAPDRTPVVGFGDAKRSFFWMAGQGGYGIQIAPALARLAASLIEKGIPPDDLVDLGLQLDQLTPQRLHPAPAPATQP